MDPRLPNFIRNLEYPLTETRWRHSVIVMREIAHLLGEADAELDLPAEWAARLLLVLRRALQHPEEAVQTHATRLVGRLGEPLATELASDLVQLAEDAVAVPPQASMRERMRGASIGPGVAGAIVKALGRVPSRNEEVSPTLFRAMRSEGANFASGLHASEAILSLVRVLQGARPEHQDAFSREAARSVFGKSGGRQIWAEELLASSFCYRVPEFYGAVRAMLRKDYGYAQAALRGMPAEDVADLCRHWLIDFPYTLEDTLQSLEKRGERVLPASLIQELLAATDQQVRLNVIRCLPRLQALTQGPVREEWSAPILEPAASAVRPARAAIAR
jgi:hypothetical protein